MTLVKLPWMLSTEGIPDTTILGDLDAADAISLANFATSSPSKKKYSNPPRVQDWGVFFVGGLFLESIRAHFCT